MSHTQPYEESFGIQAGWMDTHEAKPYKIKPKFFIDVDDITVASASSLSGIMELLENYPEGVLRHWAPSQEEYEQQISTNKELALNNWGIMTPTIESQLNASPRRDISGTFLSCIKRGG